MPPPLFFPVHDDYLNTSHPDTTSTMASLARRPSTMAAPPYALGYIDIVIKVHRELQDVDDPIEDVVDDNPVLPFSFSSSAPPSSYVMPPLSAHCIMTIEVARSHYMDMVWEEGEEQFWEVQANAAYNHHHLQAEEQIHVGGAVVPDVDLAE
ncbi:hypothetical protein D1007_24665 [Hordeum vulgare]|nr:hypothetical protein D1007_24665 [Hordeum vulgare]